MIDLTQYHLHDFGHGRKLEEFAGVWLDRPSPAALGTRPLSPELWQRAHARFERLEEGRRAKASRERERPEWEVRSPVPQPWHIQHGPLTFELKLTDFGHVGLFPEQTANWSWIEGQVRGGPGPLKVMNLFAYTGASTLAAAGVGAEVVHVDAARTTLSWARRNAAHSGLAERPIRWIVEDARKFVGRELKRGNRYDAVILDPPTYGHGPQGQAWKLAEDLPPLLQDCGKLLAGGGRFLLLTCHAPGIGPDQLRQMMQRAMAIPPGAAVESGGLGLTTPDGRVLPSGVYSRWSIPAQGSEI